MGFNGLSFKYVSSVMGWIMHIQRETTQFVQLILEKCINTKWSNHANTNQAI